MPPLRRYIRISPHHTILALIFLEEPSDLYTWLIHPSKPALPRIVDALRDVVPAKIREELDVERRSSTRKTKTGKTSDVVVGDDFTVKIYLKDNTQRHAILLKHRVFGEAPQKLKSNSNKLGVGSDAGGDTGDARILQEEDEDGDGSGGGGGGAIGTGLSLNDIPLFAASQGGKEPEVSEKDDTQENTSEDFPPEKAPRRSTRTTRSRRNRSNNSNNDAAQEDDDAQESAEKSDDSFEQMVIDDDEDDDDGFQTTATRNRRKAPSNTKVTTEKTKPSGKRRREAITIDSDESGSEQYSRFPPQIDQEKLQEQLQLNEEKKPLLSTTYEGYSIFGKALYMIVKRKPTVGPRGAAVAADSGIQRSSTDGGGSRSQSTDVGVAPSAGAAAGATASSNRADKHAAAAAAAAEGVMDEWIMMSQTIGLGDDE